MASTATKPKKNPKQPKVQKVQSYNATRKVIEKRPQRLYFGKFGFKWALELENQNYSYQKYSLRWARNNALTALKKECVDLIPKDALYRSRQEFNTLTFYFECEKDLDAFIVAVQPVIDPIQGHIGIERLTESQLDVAWKDAKVEFRKDLYFKKYEFKFRGMLGEDSVLEILTEFFPEEDIERYKELYANRRKNGGGLFNYNRVPRTLLNSRAKISIGSYQYATTTVHFKDQNEAMIGRLLITEQMKINRADITTS